MLIRRQNQTLNDRRIGSPGSPWDRLISEAVDIINEMASEIRPVKIQEMI